MTDRKKVIRGLECLSRLSQDGTCAGCAYFRPFEYDPDTGWCDRTEATKDALALLREQEPEKLRLYTAEEMQHLPDRMTVCVERLISREDDEHGYITGCGWGVVWNRTCAEDGGIIHAGMLGSFFPNTITKIPFKAVERDSNGKRITVLYRFWTDRPTKEQSEAVKWDG